MRTTVIGITGGIGSGKTTVCSIFQALGVPVYNADERAKELMNTNPTLRAQIIDAFGAESYDAENRLNRPYIAQQVFNSSKDLNTINALVHPVVASDFEEWVDLHSNEKYVLKEAAILFESGANKYVDVSVLVVAPEALRIARVTKRDASTEEEVLKRMKNQWTQERKVKLADFIIHNDGVKLLIPQVIKLHQAFTQTVNY